MMNADPQDRFWFVAYPRKIVPGYVCKNFNKYGVVKAEEYVINKRDPPILGTGAGSTGTDNAGINP